MFMLFALCLSICHLYSYILAPSNRSPLKAFVDLNVSGGDLLEGAGIYIYIYHCLNAYLTRVCLLLCHLLSL